MTAPDRVNTRLWERVDRSGGAEACWPFVGSRTREGYGQIGAREAGKLRKFGAHRVAFFLSGRALGPGQEVAHDCGNPPCCNPAHLRADSHAGNMADRVRHGTIPRGERNGRAKLGASKVLELRERHARGEGCCALAREVGLNVTSMSDLLRGINWKHLPLPVSA